MHVRHEDGLRPEELARLLGREFHALDLRLAKSFFANRRVLVTGAGGSIGSALCRTLVGLGCPAVFALDSSDHSLIDLLESVQGVPNGNAVREAVCDVRDERRLLVCMSRAQPDVVIHAAALKHVHMGERHPSESVLTNLVGVRNAFNASQAVGAGRFLLVSSDKAAAPTSVMGASKRLAELFLAGRSREIANESQAMKAMAVRFGNVFGSKGSVAPLFARQIEAGGPLTVTHPEMQRYFMSLVEAVQLILKVCAEVDQAESAATYLLDMGEPVKILDLAKRMIAASGKSVAIAITNVREGEKLNEVLSDDAEWIEPSGIAGVQRIRPLNPSAEVVSADVSEMERVARTYGDDIIRHRLFALLDSRIEQSATAAG